MAYLIKKCWTAPLPPGATIHVDNGVRIAIWTLRNGEPRSAEVVDGAKGKPRIRGKTATYVARYRDAEGVMREKPTGCRDERAARAVLTQLERSAELIKSGLVTAEEQAAAKHRHQPFSEHLDDHVRHLELKGCAPHRITQVRARLERVARDCKIACLADLTPAAVEAWLLARKREGLSAGTLGGYRQVVVGMANWAVRSGRLLSHRLDQLPRASIRADRRRIRRAFGPEELLKLLDAAARRPLNEALLVRRGPRRGALAAKVDPEVCRRLEALGRERALAYTLLASTGLRRSELASLTVGQADLDSTTPRLLLEARNEKSRRGATIPLRSDVAEDLRRWLDEKLERARERADRVALPIPDRLPASTKLLKVPTIRIFDKDIAFAGVAKVDERGRTLDIHCLRSTFCTGLMMAGVPLRVAQAALRHSSPVLTAVTYTDEGMLDVRGAIERLPSMVPQAASRVAST